MKIIKVSVELVIDESELDGYLKGYTKFDSEKEKIANYLNTKLYEDPEFFGDFGPENIVELKEWE